MAEAMKFPDAPENVDDFLCSAGRGSPGRPRDAPFNRAYSHLMAGSTELNACADGAPEGLVYSRESDPGIRRRRHGKGFRYVHSDGKALTVADKERIRKLGIPPAYENVWICADPNGHLQATGQDARGRRQYRYHPAWASWRADRKYGQLVDFGAALPALRRRLSGDLSAEPGAMAYTLAALVMLLDRTFLRIGNAAYAAENNSYGATTLLSRHLKLSDGVVMLRFRAKGGKRVQQTLRDRKLHRILQSISDLPGRNLFTWIDADGTPRPIGSHHVNTYLTDLTGIAGASAKTFRTWGGSLAAFEVALKVNGPLSIRAMAEAAAERLANTPAISRSSYIHPAILDLSTLSTERRASVLAGISPVSEPGLNDAERHMLAYLRSAQPATE
jgi:DNA topoisomerase I